ncbi:hypothetical protein L3X38_024230 [Prunus dulcis]|uniref:Uncharacterized protein n=1 Tax=Prunus dulcis TaxID=3755 RepID=A0AAD4W245_PRUDU|nr:hypothetical protein L3X38_024230 [Prunus dulcis]
MGSVSKPDNLRHVRPEYHITYLPIRRYNQRHVWGLSKRRITYATCDLNTVSHNLLIRRYNQRHVWGLNIISQISPYAGTTKATYGVVPVAGIGRDGKRRMARFFWDRCHPKWWPDVAAAAQKPPL